MFHCDFLAHVEAVRRNKLALTPSSENDKELWRTITKGSSLCPVNDSYSVAATMMTSEEISKQKKRFDYV